MRTNHACFQVQINEIGQRQTGKRAFRAFDVGEPEQVHVRTSTVSAAEDDTHGGGRSAAAAASVQKSRHVHVPNDSSVGGQPQEGPQDEEAIHDRKSHIG